MCSERAPAPPYGVQFFFATWSGRILVINFLVFVYTCYLSGAILMPTEAALITVGARYPLGLALGEYWRLFTPVFVHIGLLHFAVNSFALYAIGTQLERAMGPSLFLGLYLSSGILGNIASSVLNVGLSAGASGAIFGLLGCGFLLERQIGKRIQQMTGQRPKNQVYAMTVLINLGFGIVVPFIDNAAHIGGLLTGVTFTFAAFHLLPNRLIKPRRLLAYIAISILSLATLIGTAIGTNQSYIHQRLVETAHSSEDPALKLSYLSQALAIRPQDSDVRIDRARVLYLMGQGQAALADLRLLPVDLEAKSKLQNLASELENLGMVQEAWDLRRLIAHM